MAGRSSIFTDAASYLAKRAKQLNEVKSIIGAEPSKTVSAYKLFRQRGDDLYPLFVNANQPVPVGQWLDAESGPLVGGKVKSSLGPLAYRPGWHAGDMPIATHIGGKSAPGLKAPDYRPDNQVWAQVDMPDDVDWQTEALARAQRNKAGVIIPRTAHITDQIPVGGHYRYKTNPNMTGEWLIGGSMKVNRILPDDEVRAVNEAAGVSDLPRLHELMRGRGYAHGGATPAINMLTAQLLRDGWDAPRLRFLKQVPRQGFAGGGSLIQDQHPTSYLPGVGRQVMADGGASPSMDRLMANVNSVFSRSSPAADPSSLIGVSSQPYRSGEAHTDAGGQKIAAPFVTGMRGGYPIPPQAQQAAQKQSPSTGYGRIDDILSRLRGKGFKGGGLITRAIKNYVDPDSKFISDWKWRPLSDVIKDVGTNRIPEHVQNFGHYMNRMADKAATEGFDPEDVIKAYMITRSSIQRQGLTPGKLLSTGALLRPTSEALVRPEGQMAEWLQTPMGIRFLNEARKGNVSQDTVEDAQRVMRPYGFADSVEPHAMKWAAENIPDRTPIVSDLIARSRAGESPISEWREFIRGNRQQPGVHGVATAKTGFLASMLGRGDIPTMDARQAILNTGMKNADVQGIMSKRSGKVGDEVVDRLIARQRALGFKGLPPELDPHYQHLTHHTIWESGPENAPTTHEDVIRALEPRAFGGRAGFAGGGWRQFADVVEKAVNAAKGVSAKERFGVYHNLDTENIDNLVRRFNGVPAPSLAISKPLGNPAEEFGKATLVGRPHLAIPTEDNHVFGADAYTPRFPHIFKGKEYGAPDQADRIAKEYLDMWGGDNEKAIETAYGIFGGEKMTPFGESIINYLKNPVTLRAGEYMFMPNSKKAVPVTAENVIAYMKAHPSILGGEGETGIGLLKAHITPRPTSLEDIQKRRYSIVDDLEEPDNDWSGVRRRFNEMHGLYRPYARDDSVYPRDQFTNALIDLHHEGVPGFMKTYRDDIPRERIGAAKSLLHDTKELMPTYMEAKPLRNVGFDEFGAAVLPFDETGRSASRSLMDAGMPEKSIQFYSEPHHRFRAFRNLAEEHGFAGGGRAARAVDVARSRLAGGGLPGERAHEFVQSQLYDEPRESPLVEQYAEPMTRYALDRNADRPMPTAHEFVQHQLNKQEPQLPQFDRAARDKMRDYAVDAIHGAGYFTPLAPALAAYDVAHGISTGDPLEMGMSILGAPGKYGKAAALAASILGTQEAQAGPYSKFIREVAERVRPHYDPSAMIKDMPRKEWISDVALSRPLHEMTARTKDFRQLLPYNRLDPEDVSGSALITGMGDRTPAGYVTTHLNEEKLRRAIDNMGGPDFPRDEPAQLEGAYWGSNFNRARAIANKGVAAARERFEPLFMYVNQGPQSQDFSHMMTDAILGQMKPSHIDKTMASEFDRLMREVEIKKGMAGISTWPGITNPKLRKWLIESKEGGAGRAKMAKLMDKGRYRDAPGFADVGVARWATTNPELMHTPNFSSGYMISRMDPQGRLITDPKIPHPSYDTLLAAPRGQQGYMGGFEYPIPPEIHFHDYFSGNSIPSRFSNSEPFVPAIKESNRDKPFEKQTMSLMREIPTVIASPKWVDMASEYQDVMRSLYGRR